MIHHVRRLCMLLAATAAPCTQATPIGLLDQDGGYVDAQALLITGVRIETARRDTLADGTPVRNALSNPDYTAMQVDLGKPDDKHETYVERFGFVGRQFASGYADGTATLEVGVDGFNDGWGGAVSRFQIHLTNFRSVDAEHAFNFFIPEMQLLAYGGPQNTNDQAISALAGARISYKLLTPDGPFGGTYAETTGTLFDLWASIKGNSSHRCLSWIPGEDEDLCAGQWVTASRSAQNRMGLLDSELNGDAVYGMYMNAFEGRVDLPTVAPRGQLFLYYDLYANVDSFRETGGKAALGDPATLVGNQTGGSVELLNGPTGVVAEPPAWSLAVLAMLAVAVARRRRSGEPLRPPLR